MVISVLSVGMTKAERESTLKKIKNRLDSKYKINNE